MSEHDEQVALFIWARLAENQHPELALLHAIPLGGLRHKGTARKLKAEGVKAGVPDVFLPVARDRFHGLYIEMKFGKNYPTDNQEWWLRELSDQGYKTVVCYGWEDAVNVISDYLGIRGNN